MTDDQKLSVLVANVVAGWSALLPYFPQDEHGKAIVMKTVFAMVNNPVELDWLYCAVVNQLGEWKGAKAMREIFCRRFRPRDGIETDEREPVFSRAEIAQVQRLRLDTKPMLLIESGEPHAGEVPELVRETSGKMPKKIRPRPSDIRAAREWCEKLGL